MTEYNGGNHHNNCVSVDFIHKTVKFDAVPRKSFIEDCGIIWFNIFSASFILSTYIILLPALILSLAGIVISDSVLKIFLIWIMTPIIISIIYLIAYLNKSIRENIFPKLNAEISQMTDWLIFSKSKKEIVINAEYQEINPKAIVNNTFIIPSAKNLVFEYEATLDYALYLEKIDIVNSYIGNPDEWQIIIKWTQQPIEGNFKMRYN